MMKTIEAEGQTIDIAIQNALDIVNMERDNVTVEVIAKEKSGFLGFGAALAKVKITFDEVIDAGASALTFIDGLLEKMGIEGKSAILTRNEEIINIEITGADMGAVIGRRGDTLDAIQYLTSLAVNNNSEKHIKISIDTENYRQKRQESLERLARKMAGKVLKARKNMTLEPMNPYERRIIHAALQDFRGITTYSTGNEPNRRVVVALANNRNFNKKEKTSID